MSNLSNMFMDEMHRLESLAENHASFDEYLEQNNISTVVEIVNQIQPAANDSQFHPMQGEQI